MGISQATFFRWKQLYGGMMPSEVKKPRQLEEVSGAIKCGTRGALYNAAAVNLVFRNCGARNCSMSPITGRNGSIRARYLAPWRSGGRYPRASDDLRPSSMTRERCRLTPWREIPTCHRFVDGVDGFAPGSSIGRRFASTCRKACRKKSSSRCCWPTFRSSSGMRCLAKSRSSVATTDAFVSASLLLGRPPRVRKAFGHSSAKIISPKIQQMAAELKLASQCAHTLSRHHPSDRRELHLPAKDWLKTRAFFGISSPPENCLYYPCLTFGVQSTSICLRLVAYLRRIW